MRNMYLKLLVALTIGIVTTLIVSKEAEANTVYAIESAFSGKCLDVEGASTADGARVVLWECNGQNNQRFEAVPIGNGMYQLVSQLSGKCLNVFGNSTDNDATIGQWTCVGNYTWNELFWLAWEDEGYYHLVAANSNKCISTDSWLGDSGQRTHQWDCYNQSNQRWKLVAVGETNTGQLPPGNYEIRTYANRCFDINEMSTESGANLLQFDCYGTANQTFSITDVGDGYYQIRPLHSGKCLDVAYGSWDDGTNVGQWGCWDAGTENQSFRIQNIGNNEYIIVTKNANKCLEIPYGDTGNRANVLQWTCWNGPNQIFKFYRK